MEEREVNLIKEDSEIFLYSLMSLLVGKVYSFPVTSAGFLHKFFEGIENARFLTAGEPASKQLCKNVYMDNIRGQWSSRQKKSQFPTESRAKDHQSTLVLDANYRHHKQCIIYNDVYINKLEKYI